MPLVEKWELDEWDVSPSMVAPKTMRLRPAGMSDFDSEADDDEWDSIDVEEDDVGHETIRSSRTFTTNTSWVFTKLIE